MNKKLLIGIVALSFLVRLIGLGQIPRGFTPDEASQAYTAYSINKTGQDEWGRPLPQLSFKSFLDYKAPLQTYLMAPAISVFGLNEFSARLPSAVFGTLAVFAIYLLANQLFPKTSFKVTGKNVSVGIVASLVLALTPWHIQFSRMALEANLTSFLFPLGLWAFLKGLKKPSWLNLTALSWGISLYAYHSFKLFLPFFVLSLLIIYFPKIKNIKFEKIIPALLIAALFSLPIYYLSVFTPAGSRGADLLVTHLSDREAILLTNVKSFSPLAQIHPYFSSIFHNQLASAADQFITNYVSYFSLSFWFTEGGREITYSIIPGTGLLFLWQLPFVLLALYNLIKQRKQKESQLLFSWLLLAPIPAALTKLGYRPNRTSALLGFWALLTSLGLVIAFKNLKSTWFKVVTALVVAISLIFYTNNYLFAHHLRNPKSMYFGFRDAIGYVQKKAPQYQKILVERGSQSQSFVAFYTQYPPEDFQEAAHRWQSRVEKESVDYLDQLDKYRLGKYSFEDLNWPEDIDSDTLYLSHKLKLLPENRRTLYQVNTPDHQTLIEVFDFPDEEK